jgi:hypothetical protein
MGWDPSCVEDEWRVGTDCTRGLPHASSHEEAGGVVVTRVPRSRLTYTKQFGSKEMHEQIMKKMFVEVPVYSYEEENCSSFLDGSSSNWPDDDEDEDESRLASSSSSHGNYSYPRGCNDLFEAERRLLRGHDGCVESEAVETAGGSLEQETAPPKQRRKGLVKKHSDGVEFDGCSSAEDEEDVDDSDEMRDCDWNARKGHRKSKKLLIERRKKELVVLRAKKQGLSVKKKDSQDDDGGGSSALCNRKTTRSSAQQQQQQEEPGATGCSSIDSALSVGRMFSSKRYSARIKAMLDEALLDKVRNPADWLIANAPEGHQFTLKQMDLMERTGLTALQIRHYMHNNARRGRRIVGMMMAAMDETAACQQQQQLPAPMSKIMKKKIPKLAKKPRNIKKLVREMIISKNKKGVGQGSA